jgi:hypothetical protein
LLALALLPGAALANNVITAEHPPYGDKGYALQSDNRLIYQDAAAFVSRDGRESHTAVRQRQGLAVFRFFIPGWMLRVSVPYTALAQNSGRLEGWGDLFFEAGASRESGDWRYRALFAAKAPTGLYDSARAVNTGSGQWDFGPSLYVTRYLLDKAVDLDLFCQYLYRRPNHNTDVKPGNELSYAAVAAVQPWPKVPVRGGLEVRGLFADPNSNAGTDTGAAKRNLSMGPAFQIKLNQWVRGLTLWPTAQWDVYDRNSNRTRLYYLKVQFNY